MLAKGKNNHLMSHPRYLKNITSESLLHDNDILSDLKWSDLNKKDKLKNKFTDIINWSKEEPKSFIVILLTSMVVAFITSLYMGALLITLFSLENQIERFYLLGLLFASVVLGFLIHIARKYTPQQEELIDLLNKLSTESISYKAHIFTNKDKIHVALQRYRTSKEGINIEEKSFDLDQEEQATEYATSIKERAKELTLKSREEFLKGLEHEKTKEQIEQRIKIAAEI